jgi:hypothetical protein
VIDSGGQKADLNPARIRLAVSVLSCQIGSSTLSTSGVSMSCTGRSPMMGWT